MKNKPLLPFVFRHWENSVGSYLVAFYEIIKWRSGFHQVFCKYFTKCWSNHYCPFLKRDYLTRFFLWEGVETHIMEIIFLLSQFHQSLMGARKEDDGWLFVFFCFDKIAQNQREAFQSNHLHSISQPTLRVACQVLLHSCFSFYFYNFTPSHPTPCHHVLFG